MKLKIVGITLGALALLGAVAPSIAMADEVATSTPMIGGGFIPFVAGNVDSIHGKGAWFISNKFNAPYVPQAIYYVAEHPEYASVWKTVMENLYHIVLQ